VIVFICFYLHLPSPLAALIPGPSPNSGRRELAGFKYFLKYQTNVGLDFFCSYIHRLSHLAALIPGPSPNSGRRELAGFKDFLEHQTNVGLDFFVPKSNDSIAKFFKLACPLFILFSLQIMDIAINLKHQSFFSAIEISDEWIKWVLTTELKSAQLPITQSPPQHLISGCHFLTYFPGALLNTC
jgi:hypothetical protein